MCAGPCTQEQPRSLCGSAALIHGFLGPFVPGGLLDWSGAEAAELMRVKWALAFDFPLATTDLVFVLPLLLSLCNHYFSSYLCTWAENTRACRALGRYH